MYKKRNTFKLSRYNNDDVGSDSPSWGDTVDNRFIKKGSSSDPASYDISTEVVEDMLRTLKEHKHSLIRELDGQAKRTYETFISMTKCLRGHPNYSTLYDMVYETFKNEKNAKPGTILAFLTGCMLHNKSNEPVGCGLSCQEGLKPPDDHGFKCQEKVVISSINDGHYSFDMVQDSASERAIVYIPKCSCNDQFKGFTENECDSLRNYGIAEIKIRGIPENSTVCIDITDGYIVISEVKPRTSSLEDSDNDDDASNIGLIIVLIILVLVVLFIGWRILYAGNSNPYY